jgi:hypothetical protein
MSEEERIRIEGEQQYQAHVMYQAQKHPDMQRARHLHAEHQTIARAQQLVCSLYLLY